MTSLENEHIITLDTSRSIWERFFLVAPLIVVGTKEGDTYNLAPKHMAMPMSWENYFGFVCAPHHQTYRNIEQTGSFAVSYPRPDQVTAASLTASERQDGPGLEKPVLKRLDTFPATQVEGVFLDDAYVYLECKLERFVDDLGDNSLILSRVVAAHVHEDALRVSEQSDQKLVKEAPLLAYLHPGRFASISETQSFPFPAHFKK